MPLATNARSNNHFKAANDSYAIILADSPYCAELSPDEATLPWPYAEFLDRQSLFELTLRRVKKAISPKRLFIIVRRKHMEIDAVAAQVNRRALHTIVLQSRRADATAAFLLALMNIYHRCPGATVTLFPVDHFMLPECGFLHHLRQAWSALQHNEKTPHILLLGMEPHAPDLGYCYIVPEGSPVADTPARFARISLIGQVPSGKIAQRLITGGALWYSGIVVAKCKTLIDVIRQTMPALSDSFAILEAAAGTAEPELAAERVYRGLPNLSARDILRSLPWEHRCRLGVMPVRGVYWSELSNQQRKRECLEKMIGLKFAAAEEAEASFDRQLALANA